MGTPAWVSFCISTYKRPDILHKQLVLLSQQTFADFEVIVSDNDPGASAKNVVEGIGDARFKYFHNRENLGMIKSFNKSIERSTTEFIVMVTDDDPVDPGFLSFFYDLYNKYPSYSLYCGFLRKGKKDLETEFIPKDSFLRELLDPGKTSNLLWSSSVVRKSDAIKIGLIPDYGSPHLADHAFIALAGSIHGGVIVNRMYSALSSHDANFSKFNFHYYVNGCEGFYKAMSSFSESQPGARENAKVISKHLGFWFIANIFTLKKYYTIVNKDNKMLKSVDECAAEILRFSFMRKYINKYNLKNMIFSIKKRAGVLK